MTNYNNYKKYHEALKNTGFTELSSIILNMQTITTKYNSELGNISNSEWQDKVNPVLQQKLLFCSKTIQSLNTDISTNIQSIIDNGAKLLEILEQMKQKQIIIDRLTRTVYELNKEKSNLHNKLSTFKDKNTEEYNTTNSKYSSALNKYNSKKGELTTSQNEIDELGIEADLLISKLQGINFTANITGLLNGETIVNQTTTPVVTSTPVSTVIPTPSPTIISAPSPTVTPNNSVVNFDSGLIENLGILIDKKTGLPLKKGNAYVAYQNGMGYLIYFPQDSNGNIKTNLPVMLEFHGSGEAGDSKSKDKAKSLPTDRMGLYQIEKNSNTQAIIILPMSSDDTWGVYNEKKLKLIKDQVKSIQNNAITSLNANKNKIILYAHSAGVRFELEYASEHPEGIKGIVAIDGRPASEAVQIVSDSKIPVLYITSQNAGEVKELNKPSYFNAINKIMKSTEIDCSFETLKTKSLDSKTISSETLASKERVETILSSVFNDKKTYVVHLMGSSHRTVRDFTTKIVDFYNILLK